MSLLARMSVRFRVAVALCSIAIVVMIVSAGSLAADCDAKHWAVPVGTLAPAVIAGATVLVAAEGRSRFARALLGCLAALAAAFVSFLVVGLAGVGSCAS